MLPLLTLLLLGSRAVADSSQDKITQLPGLNDKINFDQYSGYLSAGNDDYFHYWFVESQQSPSKDPLILWFNGGPGCSSMDGFLDELGPFRPSYNGSLLNINPYSWNTFANVLFVESPACVGFSYNSNGDCSASDDSTSLANLNALKSFFEKFPQFKRNDFYVTGESYAGVYVPTLVQRILQENNENEGGKSKDGINLKAYAIGNGLTWWKTNYDSLLFFGQFHGLLGQKLWDESVALCCDGGVATRDGCEFTQTTISACKEKVEVAMRIMLQSGINMYNLYGECRHPHADSGVTKYHVHRNNILRYFGSAFDLGLSDDPPCTDGSNMRNYLNRDDVKKAIHVKQDIKWDVCNMQVNRNYKMQYLTVEPIYDYIFKQGLPGLNYNGDIDMAINYLGNQWFFEARNLTVVEPRRMWHVNDQVAGFVKRFKNLDFMTVKGAGHMVPTDKPAEALHLIKAFIQGKDY